MKFEFSDLYKFIVSLGVILVTLAILGPWLFLREPFDLQVKANELQELTETARQTIVRRQEIVLIATRLWPWLSPFSAILGLALIFTGIRSWHRNQIELDAKTAAESKLAQHRLRNATAQEKVARKQEEAAEPLTVAEMESGKVEGGDTTSVAMRTEQMVIDKIRTIAPRHHVLTDQVIDDSYFDLILESRELYLKSYVVEIKYVSRAFSYAWLRQTACQVRQQATIYSHFTNSLLNSALLVVMPDGAWNGDEIENHLERLSSDLRHRGGKHCVRIVTQNELEQMAPLELAERLQLSL